jgi:hypothetical protein
VSQINKKPRELAIVLCEVVGMPTGTRKEEEEEEEEEGSLATRVRTGIEESDGGVKMEMAIAGPPDDMKVGR